MTPHATPGRHILADFRGVPAALLADAAALERELVLAAEAAGRGCWAPISITSARARA